MYVLFDNNIYMREWNENIKRDVCVRKTIKAEKTMRRFNSIFEF